MEQGLTYRICATVVVGILKNNLIQKQEVRYTKDI